MFNKLVKDQWQLNETYQNEMIIWFPFGNIETWNEFKQTNSNQLVKDQLQTIKRTRMIPDKITGSQFLSSKPKMWSIN